MEPGRVRRYIRRSRPSAATAPEERLATPHDLAAALFDALPAPAFALDADGTVAAWNGAAARAFGWSAVEIVGRAAPIAGSAGHALFATTLAALRAGKAATLDLLLVAQDGGAFPARLRGELLRVDGRPDGIVFLAAHGASCDAASALDPDPCLAVLAEHRRTQEDLRRALEILQNAESRFAKLIESSPDLVLIHRDGRILYANPAMAAIVGRPGTDLSGTPVLDWVHPDDRAPLAHRLAAEGRLAPREWRILASGGRNVPVEFIAIGLEMPDGPVRVAIGRDLSERKQTEERMRRSDRLASLGTLAAGVAHELNNPLSFVLANAEWALDRLAGERAPSACELAETARAVEDIVQGAQRMRVIVSDLRTAARDESISDTMGPVDLGRVVDFAVQLTAGEIRRRAALEVSREPVPAVVGSETRLGQVVVNLLVNASQAMADADPARNAIRVALRAGPGASVTLAVTDNGCGMAPAVRRRLFEPFFTTKPVGEGTGLGLWVCHNIVTAHGGEIDVESAPGQGTTFRVRLPAAEPGRAAGR